MFSKLSGGADLLPHAPQHKILDPPLLAPVMIHVYLLKTKQITYKKI